MERFHLDSSENNGDNDEDSSHMGSSYQLNLNPATSKKEIFGDVLSEDALSDLYKSEDKHPGKLEALEENKDENILSLLNMAREEYSEGNLRLCLEALHTGLCLKPNSISLHLERAAVYGNLSAFEEARRDVCLALKQDSRHEKALMYLHSIVMAEAKELEENGNFITAAKLYEQLLRVFKSDPNLHSKHVHAVLQHILSFQIDPEKDNSNKFISLPQNDLEKLLTNNELNNNEEQKKHQFLEQAALEMEGGELNSSIDTSQENNEGSVPSSAQSMKSSAAEDEKSWRHNRKIRKSSPERSRNRSSSAEDEKSWRYNRKIRKSSPERSRNRSSAAEDEKSWRHNRKIRKSSPERSRNRRCYKHRYYKQGREDHRNGHFRRNGHHRHRSPTTHHRRPRSHETYHRQPQSHESYHRHPRSRERYHSRSRSPDLDSHHSSKNLSSRSPSRNRRIGKSPKAVIRDLILDAVKRGMYHT